MAFLQTLKHKITGKDPGLDTAFSLYNALVEEARSPALFDQYDIPDTIDGRFDVIVLHIALFLIGTAKTLEAAGQGELGRELIGIFLKDMDRNLREIGVGDLSVGKQVKKMAAGLYGRVQGYEAALADLNPESALARALTRNLYRDAKISKSKAGGLSRHSLKVFKRMKKLTLENILTGTIGGSAA